MLATFFITWSLCHCHFCYGNSWVMVLFELFRHCYSWFIRTVNFFLCKEPRQFLVSLDESKWVLMVSSFAPQSWRLLSIIFLFCTPIFLHGTQQWYVIIIIGQVEYHSFGHFVCGINDSSHHTINLRLKIPN